MIEAKTETGLDLGSIQWELIYHIDKRGKVKAAELAELVGITIPSVRVRLLPEKKHAIAKFGFTSSGETKRMTQENRPLFKAIPRRKQTARERRGKGAARREADAL